MKVKQGNKELLEKEFEEFFQANYSRFIIMPCDIFLILRLVKI